MRIAPVPDDEAARSQLTDEPGNSSQREIDPNPRGIGMQFRDDQRRKHRRQRPGDRAAGLLQKHRRDRDQHLGQLNGFSGQRSARGASKRRWLGGDRELAS
jgi:hypothetical protein